MVFLIISQGIRQNLESKPPMPIFPEIIWYRVVAIPQIATENPLPHPIVTTTAAVAAGVHWIAGRIEAAWFDYVCCGYDRYVCLFRSRVATNRWISILENISPIMENLVSVWKNRKSLVTQYDYDGSRCVVLYLYMWCYIEHIQKSPSFDPSLSAHIYSTSSYIKYACLLC